jgi:hypothetical protein
VTINISTMSFTEVIKVAIFHVESSPIISYRETFLLSEFSPDLFHSLRLPHITLVPLLEIPLVEPTYDS